LDSLSPEEFKSALKKMNGEIEETVEIKVDLSKRENVSDEIIFDEPLQRSEPQPSGNGSLESFQDYEKSILGSIKPLENMLSGLLTDNKNNDDIQNFVVIMQKNAQLSYQKRFEVIGNMHSILGHALNNIVTGKLVPERSSIDSMRACMIVIVALIKGKEVDIRTYLNKAEEFGRRLIN
ncbi:MAG TPA: hypothetical protein VH917_03640, partial [Ignavibacteriaceae bacterium]